MGTWQRTKERRKTCDITISIIRKKNSNCDYWSKAGSELIKKEKELGGGKWNWKIIKFLQSKRTFKIFYQGIRI